MADAANKCGTCKHFRATPLPAKATQRPDEGACFAHPPTVHKVPVQVKPSPVNPQGVLFGTESVYPPVFGEIHYCGEWAPAVVLH